MLREKDIDHYIMLHLSGRTISSLFFIELLLLLLMNLHLADLINVILSLFSVFLIPGMFLIVVFLKDSSKISITELMVLSLSTSVLTISSIVILSAYLSYPLNNIFLYLVLVSILSVVTIIYVVTSKEVTITFSKAEVFHIPLSIICFLFLVDIFFNLPHYPPPDEAIYLLNARYLLLKGELFGFSYSYWRDKIVVLMLDGRYLWISIVSAFISFANISPIHANLIGFIFLFGITLSIPLLMPSPCRNDVLSRLFSLIFGLISPFIINSSFAMPDIPITFYSSISITFFIDAFKDFKSSKTIKLDSLALALMLQIIIIMIKINILVLVSFVIFLLLFVVKYKLYKIRKYAFITALFIAPLLVYEIFIDIPRNIALYIIKNEHLAILLSKYITLISPVELIIANSSKLLNYTCLDYLLRIYKILSPEALSLIVVANAISSVFIGERENNFHIRLLFSFTWITILFGFIYLLFSGGISDIIRNFSPIYPCIVSLASVSCKHIISRASLKDMLVPLLPMVTFLFLNALLINYDSPPWSPSLDSLKISLLQLIAYTLIMLVCETLTFKKYVLTVKFSFRTIRFNFLNFLKLMCLSLLILTILINVYSMSISYQAIAKTSRDYGQISIERKLNNTDTNVVFTNAYGLLALMPDYLLLDGFAFTFPKIDELNIMHVGNMKLLISDSKDATWLNEMYVDAYPRSQEIFQETIEKVYDLSNAKNDGSTMNVSIVYKPEISNYVFRFNGKNSYMAFPSFSSQNFTELTLETLINPVIDGKPHDIVSKGNDTPINNSGSFILRIENTGIISFLIIHDNKIYQVVGPKLASNFYYHIVTVFDGFYMKIYVNGTLFESRIIEEDVTLSNMSPILVGCQNLPGYFYYRGDLLLYLRIYNKALEERTVVALFQNQSSIPSQNLVLWIKPKVYRWSLINHIRTPSGNNLYIYKYNLEDNEIMKSPQNKKIYINSIQFNVTGIGKVTDLIKITLNCTSLVQDKITILIGTPEFSKIFTIIINEGENVVTISLPSYIQTNGGPIPYGAVFTRWTNVLIIDSGKKVVYSNTISLWNVLHNEMAFYFTVLVVIIIIICALVARILKSINANVVRIH